MTWSEEDKTSSEEEEIPSEEEETSSNDDNDEPSKPQSPIPPIPAEEKSKSKDSLAASTSTIPSKPQSRASSFDSESDTVEDRPTGTADPKRIKPIDEIEETSKFKKPTMKRSHDGAVSDSERAKKGKDAAKEDDGTNAKADSKKQFQIIFSDDDAIAVLNGMLEFKRMTGAIPQKKDLNAFHDSIKEALHADVSNNQLYDKIRKLRSKYKKNKKREYNPSEPHEKKAYELSKKVWPEEEENGGTEMPKPHKKNQNNAVGTSFMSLAEKILFERTSPGLSLFDGETLRKI